MSELIQSAKENGLFLLTCLAIAVGLIVLAAMAQKLLCRGRRSVPAARRVAFVAMFAAVAAVLMLFEIPLFFAPSFYKMDFSEIPVLLCSFYLGPVAGVVCELVKVLIKLLLKGTTTAFVGDFANFVVGCTLILPASVLYHAHRTRGYAIAGMALGTVCMTVFGSAFNAVYLLPRFAVMYGISLDAIMQKRRLDGDKAEIVIITHKVRHADMMAALSSINGLDCVCGESNYIRVEDEDN